MSFSSGKNLQNNINTTEAQTLSNKTMDSTTVIQSGADIQTPAIIDPSRSDVKKDTLANLQTYASTASNGQMCYATDSKKMFQVLDGALAEVGGGAGGINYISNPDAEVNADGWNNYANTTPGVLPDDFGGTVNGGWSTIAASPSSPLRGSKSFIFGGINGGANDLQGHGVYSSFTVDSADLAKKLTISFDYLIDDAALSNAVDGMLRVYIYDEDKSQLIRVNGEDLQLNANSGTHYAQFQTDSVSTNYRLVIHQALALNVAEDYAIRMDNVQVGPTVISHGTILTDSTILTGSDVTDLINLTGWQGARMEYRRVGERLVGSFYVRKDGVAGSGSTELKFTLPDNLQGVLNTEDGFTKIGNGDYYNDSNGAFAVNLISSTEMGLWKPSAIASYKYSDIIQTQYISFNFDVKIEGWSSNAKMSEDLGGREVVFYTEGLDAQTFSTTSFAYEKLTFPTPSVDTVAAWNSGTNEYTIPETGYYDISAGYSRTFGAAPGVVDTSLGIFKNGSDFLMLDGFYTQNSDTFYSYKGSINSVLLEKGDVIYAYARKEGTTASSKSGDTRQNYLTIAKRSSPQTILETETVAARYTSNSGQSIGSGVQSVIVFEDKDGDTHNAYNTANGNYVVPVSGWYIATMNVEMANDSLSDTSYLAGEIYVNSSRKGYNVNRVHITEVDVLDITVTAIFYAEKGQIVQGCAFSNVATPSVSTGDNLTYFSIARVK